MSLPSSLLSTTCDIYRGNPPPNNATPAATDVPCQLVASYLSGSRALNNNLKTWTHYIVLNSNVDIRDGYQGSTQVWQYQNADTIHIPSGGTTAYAVVFVEVRGRGTVGEHKRVYLDRQGPSWPAV